MGRARSTATKVDLPRRDHRSPTCTEVLRTPTKNHPASNRTYVSYKTGVRSTFPFSSVLWTRGSLEEGEPRQLPRQSPGAATAPPPLRQDRSGTLSDSPEPARRASGSSPPSALSAGAPGPGRAPLPASPGDGSGPAPRRRPSARARRAGPVPFPSVRAPHAQSASAVSVCLNRKADILVPLGPPRPTPARHSPSRLALFPAGTAVPPRSCPISSRCDPGIVRLAARSTTRSYSPSGSDLALLRRTQRQQLQLKRRGKMGE